MSHVHSPNDKMFGLNFESDAKNEDNYFLTFWPNVTGKLSELRSHQQLASPPRRATTPGGGALFCLMD